MQHHRRVACLLLAVFFVAAPSFAWGNRGHQIVALLAYQHLTPTAQGAADTLPLQQPDDRRNRYLAGRLAEQQAGDEALALRTPTSQFPAAPSIARRLPEPR